MKLYIYDHCPFCARARMIFGLKGIPVELVVILEDDVDTPQRLIGRKSVPILQRADGRHMGESLEIVRHVDAIGDPMLTAPARASLDLWGRNAWPSALRLIVPRFTDGDFPELATDAARTAYKEREVQAFGDLDALMRATPTLLAEMNWRLAELAPLISSTHAALGESDILLWPILRSLSIVDGLEWPVPVRNYAERLSHRGGVSLLFDQRR